MATLKQEQIVSCDPEVTGGVLVFAGTQVGVKTLVDCIEAGLSLDDFLDGFPAVGRRQAVAYLRITLDTAEHVMGARSTEAPAGNADTSPRGF